ncbi:1-aminocyclopropane-1-carboxylate deaminase/D-cysteine desulfhydrase [Vibrio comitans]|uniref:D-cysteine desulfhydrase n=1 Tax=Vibrio comitans NBRC 102076 TaxID=1219078 RepID=A0A4Y3IIM3_9VIBR|nr:pyridoxal-phosphate dependent enzyme [Vibrio comitans]GEA59343.1 D-cysteine desulfhydrase [Vibrio comitans NBRC 102076]
MSKHLLRTGMSKLPKANLGFFPTPLHKLDNISKDIGVNIFMKREDFSGLGIFGGNKIRKLEYLMGEAINKNCDTVITYGATQSNHALQTIAAANKLGLKAVVLLVEFVKPKELKSNFLLNHVMDADIRTIPVGDMNIEEITKEVMVQGRAIVEEYQRRGHKVFDCPVGGNNELGSIGAIDTYLEISEQMHGYGGVDYIVQTTGTGGSLSGLQAARTVMGEDNAIEIISISAAPREDLERYCLDISTIASGSLTKLGIDKNCTPSHLKVDCSFVGQGYELPSEGGTNAIHYVAKREGITLDPTYTGKGFDGLLHYVNSGVIPQGSNVVFIHTGGSVALFSESEIVGELGNSKTSNANDD